MKKLAILRENEQAPCPFGLTIPKGCREAGDLVKRLTLLENGGSAEKNQSLVENNSQKGNCAYANKIIDGNNTEFVECDAPYNTRQEKFPVGSPVYYKPMGGAGIEGLNTMPEGYYNDNSIDRGYYYGMYSIESIASIAENLEKQIEKQAKKKIKNDNNHPLPRDKVIYQNYDYTGDVEGNETSPGGGFYFGNMSRHKSVKEFLDKKEKARKKFREAVAILENLNKQGKKQ